MGDSDSPGQTAGEVLMRPVLMVLLFLLLGAAAACAQNEGEARFQSDCARCHNRNGDGKTAAGAKMRIPDLRSAEVQSLSDDQLYQTIANGARHKQYPHAFLSKGMHEGDIRKLVAHIRKLAKR